MKHTHIHLRHNMAGLLVGQFFVTDGSFFLILSGPSDGIYFKVTVVYLMNCDVLKLDFN